MASCKVEPIPTPPEPENVVLRLTTSEARALRAALGAVGGDPDQSWRKHTEAVYKTLSSFVSHRPYTELYTGNIHAISGVAP